MPNEYAATDPINGLSEEEVAERVENGRINGDPNVKTKSVKQIFLKNPYFLNTNRYTDHNIYQ